MDITDTESIEKLFDDTVKDYGKIDILVNNAANVGLKDGRIDELTLEMWDSVFQSDVRGTCNIMVNRYGGPEDIGHMCVYLGSDESSYVTGQIINVDGGLNSHVPTVAQFREMKSRTW